jgi:hypothetical protein
LLGLPARQNIGPVADHTPPRRTMPCVWTRGRRYLLLCTFAPLTTRDNDSVGVKGSVIAMNPGSVGKFVAWLFFRSERTDWRGHCVAAMLASVAVIVGVVHFDLVGQARMANLPLGDHHARTSLDQALVFTTCGKYGYVSPLYHQTELFPRLHFLGSEFVPPNARYSDVFIARHGSLARFCEQSVERKLNSENSSFLMLSALLAFPPDDTPATLSVKTTTVRCALLFATLYLASLFGMGIAPLIAIALAACRVIEIGQTQHLLSIYPTMPLLLGLTGAMATIACVQLDKLSGVLQLALGVGFGLILAFIFNFRTSYGMASIGQFVIAIVVHKFWTSTAALSYVRLTSGLVAGFLAFQVSVIWPLERDYKGTNYANHPIWHPIVLGLGNPPSPLSDREGIRWSDDVGRILARRIDPDVRYLSPGYDRALRSYYLRLWQNHPQEMLAIYKTKLILLGDVLGRLVSRIFDQEGVSAVFAKLFSNGIAWIAVVSVCGLFFLFTYPFKNALSLWGVMLALATLFVSLEQALIVTLFNIAYQGALVVCFVALLATIASILAAWIGSSASHRNRTAAEAKQMGLSG